MRQVAAVLTIVAVFACGCAPRAGDPGAALAPPVPTLPPGATAKIGAGQVGEVSPIPAFRALGDGWRLQAEGVEGMRMSARLQRDGYGEENATLVYGGTRGATPRTHVLAGTLYRAHGGDRPIEVVLVREHCSNAEGDHAWRAEVRIDGAAMLAGCADVAT